MTPQYHSGFKDAKILKKSIVSNLAIYNKDIRNRWVFQEWRFTEHYKAY